MTKYLIVTDYSSGICTVMPVNTINTDEDLSFDYEEYVENNEAFSSNSEWFIGTLNFQ